LRFIFNNNTRRDRETLLFILRKFNFAAQMLDCAMREEVGGG